MLRAQRKLRAKLDIADNVFAGWWWGGVYVKMEPVQRKSDEDTEGKEVLNTLFRPLKTSWATGRTTNRYFSNVSLYTLILLGLI